jgi:hypothetical protein
LAATAADLRTRRADPLGLTSPRAKASDQQTTLVDAMLWQSGSFRKNPDGSVELSRDGLAAMCYLRAATIQ